MSVENILSKISAYKAETEKNAISPASTGLILEDIVASLNNVINQLSNYVSKEELEGKGYAEKTELDAVKATQPLVVDEGSFVWAVTDAHGKLLLGVTNKGEVEWTKGVPTPVRMALQELAKTLSSLVSANAKEISQVSHSASVQTMAEASSPEWIWSVTDAEGRLLLGIKADGGIEWGKGIPTPIKEALAVVAHLSETVTEEEYLEMTIDADGRVLGYRTKDGRRHEEKMSVTEMQVNERLTLGKNAQSDLAKTLASMGLGNGGATNPLDLSNESTIQIPEPRCAVVNLTNITSMPTTKTDDLKAYLEFWDGQGNYFKKRVILNAQGSSSLYHTKKNNAVDFCEDEWEGDETTSIRIGDWVAQDSFHVKAFYFDAFRGICPVAYKIWDEVYRSRGIDKDRPYKALFVDDYKDYGYGYEEPDDIKKNYNENARTFPDGFPVLTFLNGVFYGVFSWQLKKHRDNMMQNKKNANHIHLDLAQNSPWSGINLEWADFEIRNPKDLYCQDGTEYDGDAPKEIMGTDSIYYDASNDKHVMTAQVKSRILETREEFQELRAMPGVASDEEIRAKIAEMWDVDTVIDYIIMTQALGNTDSYFRNIQWATWNGEKWAACPYDWDTLWGIGLTPVARSVKWFKYWTCSPEIDDATRPKIGKYQPFAWVFNYYQPELKARYKYLRESGILSTENIIKHLNEWIERIGTDNYAREFERWNETPGWRDGHINSGYWHLDYDNKINVVESDGVAMVGDKRLADLVYNPAKSYTIGDTVLYGKTVTWKDAAGVENRYYEYWRFVCATDCAGEAPITEFYNKEPYTLGYHESIYRVKKWSDEMLEWMDGVLIDNA